MDAEKYRKGPKIKTDTPDIPETPEVPETPETPEPIYPPTDPDDPKVITPDATPTKLKP